MPEAKQVDTIAEESLWQRIAGFLNAMAGDDGDLTSRQISHLHQKTTDLDERIARLERRPTN